MRRFLTLPIFLLFLCGAQAQTKEGKKYIYPVRGVAGLCTANFGEIRPGHFHAGVDIKTDGAIGREVVAIADGYVSRVTVTAAGYGRALYLTLGDGTTAVYGHLSRFSDDIEEQLRGERYARRSNSANLRFEAERFRVKQGDVVAYSGNSGSSMGPHLHIELRDAQTQRYRNLVRDGVIRPADNIPPRILKIHYIEIDTVAGNGVCLHAAPRSYPVVRGADGRYKLLRGEAVEVGRKGYFVAEVIDRRNNVSNSFGTWRITASVDGKPYFEYRMDGFTPAQSRFSNAVCCYPLQLGTSNEAIRLAQLEEAPDAFYPVMTERGIIRTAPGQRRQIRIEAEDDSGNRTQIEFMVRGRSAEFCAKADTAAVVVRPGRASTVALGRDLQAMIPAGAVYEPVYCRPEAASAPSGTPGIVVLSPVYRVFDRTVPLRLAMRISIRTEIPHALEEHAALASVEHNGRFGFLGGDYAEGIVTAKTRADGWYAVVADTLAPVVTPLFTGGADLSKAAALRFRVRDNFSGIHSWELLIDGEWVPCDRFPADGTLVYFFDTPKQGQRHTAQLRVTDGCGNTTRAETTFSR